VRLIRRLASIFFAPRYLALLGSLLDLVDPRFRWKIRRIIFRPLGGALAASFYRRVTGISRLKATLGGGIAGSLYRLRTYGVENLPDQGFLLVANHSSVFDAILLQLACPRPMRFLARESISRHRWANQVFNLVGGRTIPISGRHARRGIEEAANYIKSGGIVCVFPEGELNRTTGSLSRLHGGFSLISRLADCDIVPAWVDGLADSVFSFSHGKRFLWNLATPLRAAIAFDNPISGRSADTGKIRQRLVELSAACFGRRPEVCIPLARATVSGLKRHSFNDAFIDGENGRRETRSELLANGIALSRWIRKNCSDERVAVPMPPGLDAVLANIAITLAGKTPINLEIAPGGDVFESVINSSQTLNAISSQGLPGHLESRGRLRDWCPLEEVLRRLKPKIMFWRVVSSILPAWLLCDVLRLPRKSDRQEGVVFFAKNDSEKPVAIVLTHQSIMASVLQLASTLKLGSEDRLMASSFFHRFACVATLWYPMIKGVPAVIGSDRVDLAKSAEVIERFGVTTLLTTPDALADYIRCVSPQRLRSVKMLIVAGNEAPNQLAEEFTRKFGKEAFAGYALAESGSLVSTNLPDVAKYHPDDSCRPGNRSDSVGKLMPGQAAQIRDPETDEVLSPHELGILWLKESNLFAGYFNDPERTAQVLHDGWFRTGEWARFDEDGFLYFSQAPVRRSVRLSEPAMAERS
jgi:acyl-[acyl-carrier-protein]-phospholipid O-acyltransferase / long-chain-fatty-acid--[acyl-carrier-protein] ligase